MTRRRALILGAAAVALALGVGVGYVISKYAASRDVEGSSTEEFVTTGAAAPKPKPKPPPAPGIAWPTFGFDNARGRVSPYRHRPPYRVVWSFRARTLVEFPPVAAYGNVYFANNDGELFAVAGETGKLVWRFRSGRVQAASPAVSNGTVFHTFLYRRSQGRSSGDGELVALDARSGRVRWRKRLAPSETSPLVHAGRVYVGDWSGRVYCFAAASGRLLWTFKTGGEVKSAISVSGRRLYVGSYDHHLYALDTLTGKQLWRAEVQTRFGAAGRFYGNAAPAYGRVFAGATDGRMYSYGATSGELRWSHQTGSYVYASPAIWDGRVYAGSYDGHFYAFDAATGEVLWRFAANGPISGSATVIDGLVYFASLRGRTYALDGRTGRRMWVFRDGEFAGVMADRERLYVVGNGRLYAFVSRARAGR